ncbi:hypothetical protein KKH23_09760 [Patescibacteria group bacterium]|nr:hypothetical protein [Patescibacteria group bacterium]
MTEDFDTYTKVENDGCTFTVTANYKVQSNGLTRVTNNSYIYKDYGAAYLSGDFEHWFEFYGIDVALTGAAYNRCILAAFWNSLGDFGAIRNSSQAAGIYYDGNTGGPHLKAFTRDGAGGGQVGAAVAISGTTLYYCIFKRVGATYSLEIYSDAARTVLVGSSTIIETAYNLRYAYGIQSLNLTGIYAADIYIQNWTFAPVKDASAILKAEFKLRQDIENLKISFIVKNASSKQLKGIFIVKHTETKNLYAKFEVQLWAALKGIFTLRQETSDLYARFEAQTNVNLYAKFTVKHTALPLNLKTSFTIRRSVPAWCTHEEFIDDIIPWHYTWNEDPLGYPVQRKAFTAHGLRWITYHSDDRLWYKTSPDGRAWSAVQTFRAAVSHAGDFYAVRFDGQYVHYAYGGGYSDPCYYRRGEPQTDGSILWSGPEVVAKAAAAGDSYRYPNIGVDEDGYPFISYSHVDSSVFKSPYVLRSSKNDGTWATAETRKLTTTTGAYYTSCISLPNGNMLVLYTRYYTADSLKAQEWDGVSWTNKDPNVDSYHTALADSEGITHLVYWGRNDDEIRYLYLSDGVWSTETVLASGGSWPVVTLDDDRLWVFWEKDDNIHYRCKTKSGVWSEEKTYDQTHGAIPFGEISGPAEETSGGYGGLTGKQIPLYFEATKKLYVLIIEYLAPELKAVFHVGQDSLNLKAEFRLTVETIPAEFVVQHANSEELFAVFHIRSMATSDLYARFEPIPVKELKGVFKVRQTYDITGFKGISFLWWGAGGLDQLVEFEMHSPTGYWRARFYDGPADYRFVFIPLSDFTELALDGSRPDPSEVTAFLWTYHSPGVRKVLDLSIWYVLLPDLKAIFTVKQSSSAALKGIFTVQH